jgi:small subunit ribosomal protein S20
LTFCQSFDNLKQIIDFLFTKGFKMQRNKSGLKRNKQSKVRRIRNRVLKSKIHTSFTAIVSSIESKNKNDAEKSLKTYMSEIDKAVKKGIIHRNNSARKKSRIMKKLANTFKDTKQSA